MYLGPWEETFKKWEIEEGFVRGTNIEELLGYDRGFKAINEVNLGFCPQFTYEIIEDKAVTVISRNSFGTARELMGVENLLISFYDQPEMVKDIMDYLTDFWIALYEKVCRHVRVDCIHIWEDMSGKQGPLISPDMIRAFMLPNYIKIADFARQHDIPFEVAAGSDVVQYREQYPEFSMLGGIDKRAIAMGKKSIDEELRRIEPMLHKNGYFPALDHLIHPEVSWKDFCYYSKCLREMIEGHRRSLA